MGEGKVLQDEACKILETTVHIQICFELMKTSGSDLKHTQMEKYYQRRPGRSPDMSLTAKNEDPGTILSEYNRYHLSLVNEDDDKGWNSEYWRYLKD